MISIIVPIYNSEKYLDKCIESILKQSKNDFEVLLINDGSFDKSAEICDYYACRDKRIKVFHNKNQGVSYSRNFGVSKAQGEFVTFVDSDDILYPEYLQHLLFSLNGSIDLAICGVNEEYRKNKWKKHSYKNLKYDLSESGDFYFENLQSIAFWGPWAKLFKTKVIKEHNLSFDINLSLGEDTKFLLDYLKHIRYVATSAYIGYEYKYGPNSLSRAGKYTNEYNVYSYTLNEMAWLEQKYTQHESFDEFILDKYLNYLMLRFKSLINENGALDESLKVLDGERERLKKISIPFSHILKFKHGVGRTLVIVSFLTSFNSLDVYLKLKVFVFLFNLKYKIKSLIGIK